MDRRHLASIVFIIILVIMLIYVVDGSSVTDAFVDAGRCGVGLPRCAGERVRCINGYCKSDLTPAFPAVSDLPMIPSTRY